METVFNEIQHSVKNWWASLLLGIVYIIVALWLMFAPLSSYVALSIVFSISMLISGILEILFAVSNRKGVPSWGWYIVGGIIDVILGIYLIAYPMVSMEVIPFIIAFWLMFRGFSSTGYSIDLKRYGTRDWGWYMAFRYPCHYMFLIDIVATGHRCTLRGLYDFFHFPHYRTIPCHAFL